MRATPAETGRQRGTPLLWRVLLLRATQLALRRAWAPRQQKGRLARWRGAASRSGLSRGSSTEQQQQCWQQQLATARQYASTKTYLALTQAPSTKQSKNKPVAVAVAAVAAQSSVGPLLASAPPAASISGPAAQKSTQQQQALTSCALITNSASEQKSKPVAVATHNSKGALFLKQTMTWHMPAPTS
jgi:hypothetical protein